MSGIKGLIDTNILIYLSKQQLGINVLFDQYSELLISRITQMEVLGFEFKDKKEENLTKQLLTHF